MIRRRLQERKYYGQGTETWFNGDKYVGEWKVGGMWTGKEYDVNGNITRLWKEGKWAHVD